jgi:hypothetical protein
MGTAIATGPFNSVSFLTDNMSAPGHKMVLGLEHALVWIAYTLATRLQRNEHMPGIRHVGVIQIFLHHDIVLRLHPLHRLAGEEVLTIPEALQLHSNRSDAGNALGERIGGD